MAVTCIFMFSGGLDSVVGAHLLADLGIDVQALHFVLPFEAGLGFEHATVKRRAQKAGVALSIVEEGAEFNEVLKSPSFGFGKHANPCIDCRIHRLIAAKRLMTERGADFVATGEVLGQRPMSQRMDSMRSVEKRSGLSGLLLRPLSAQLLPPTLPEQDGRVDRGRLLAISGRGRKEQLAYAATRGLEHGSPAGGCILTNEKTAGLFEDMCRHTPDWGFEDLRLIAWGRRFRMASDVVLLVGRNAAENAVLQKLCHPDDHQLELADVTGPFAFVRGPATPEQLFCSASIVVRYAGHAAGAAQVRVTLRRHGGEQLIRVSRAEEELCDKLRV